MNAWQTVKLADVVRIKHGYAFKGEFFRGSPPGDILLTPGNFAIGGGFKFGKLKYYDGPAVPGFLLNAGDLLVTMTDLSKAGDTLGYPALVPADGRRYLHNQRLGKVLIADDRVDKHFIYWLMRTKPYRDEVLSSATGSTVKHTSPSKISAFSFSLPPRIQQDAICEVLNSLDNKIELNRRMNETLEAMAQAIFRDWFIDFGPVRRKMEGATDPVAIMGRLTSDPERAAELVSLFPDTFGDGGLPTGWRSYAFSDVAELIKRQVAPATRPDELFRHYSLPAFDAGGSPALDAGGTIKSNKFVVPDGTVLLSKLNPDISRVWLPDDGEGPAQVSSTEFLVLQPKHGRSLLYALCCDAVFKGRLEAMVTGTSKSHQRVSPPALMSQTVIVGLPVLFCEFESLAGAMLRRVLSARAESRTLAETRDYLLPRLMSGQVRVGDALEQVSEAAA